MPAFGSWATLSAPCSPDICKRQRIEILMESMGVLAGDGYLLFKELVSRYDLDGMYKC